MEEPKTLTSTPPTPSAARISAAQPSVGRHDAVCVRHECRFGPQQRVQRWDNLFKLLREHLAL